MENIGRLRRTARLSQIEHAVLIDRIRLQPWPIMVTRNDTLITRNGWQADRPGNRGGCSWRAARTPDIHPAHIRLRADRNVRVILSPTRPRAENRRDV
jgi:hypothetical protein